MIVPYSGANDNAVAIAVSGRQTSWRYSVTPDKYFAEPSHQPSGEYAQSLGEGTSRLYRGHPVYQTMGHTALFVRIEGFRQEPVVGFFPREGWLGSLTPQGWEAKKGGAVEGAWHNDSWMFNDNAALAFEIPISFGSVNSAHALLKLRLRHPTTRFQYQTRQDPGDSDTAARNCVAAAMLLLEEIWSYCVRGSDHLDSTGRKEMKRVVRQMKELLATRGYLQGQMQQLVQTGFTHMPTEGGEG